MPVIGFLNTQSPSEYTERLLAFYRGLADAGYVEGRNVTIEYRWAEGHSERLPPLAADLVNRRVSVIVTAGQSIPAARAATTEIPIVFVTPVDPVQLGWVASLAHPGGNLTGITNLNIEVNPERLEFLHELIPGATSFALLVNRAIGPYQKLTEEAQAAARALGLELHVLHAGTDPELDAAFASIGRLGAGGLVIGNNPFFNIRLEQIAALALRYAVPTIFQYREFAAAGGLMSYGGSITEGWRLSGIYAGRILNGDKPTDLPVQQQTKIELVLNLKTAKALGLTVPITLLGRADEVIE
jgi:putative tryptophan/tyrosine transport system substrate-binding protein